MWGPGNTGGIAGLKLKIVIGLSMPETASDNTIWVKTGRDFGKYTVSVQPPSNPAEGDVWVQTGTASTIHINLTGSKNPILITPIRAYQHFGGKWEPKDAKSYHGGSWHQWIFAIYQDGTEYRVNGISVSAVGGNSTAEKLPDKIRLAGVFGTLLDNRLATAYTDAAIDLTPYSRLTLVASTQLDRADAGGVKIGVTKNVADFNTPTKSHYNQLMSAESKKTGQIEVTYDISDLAGDYYIGVYDWVQLTDIYGITLV